MKVTYMPIACFIFSLFIVNAFFPFLIKHIPIQTRVQIETFATDILIGP